MGQIFMINKEDILKCSELFVEAFNNEPWNDKWTLETAKKRLNDIYMTPNFVGILYAEDGNVKGAIFGNCEQYYNGIHYNLKELFISNELQGKGIGSELVNALEERLIELDVTKIILVTSKGNGTSKFYLNNNFYEDMDMALMTKDIFRENNCE
ncbi:GNAT family N-acetyltransferase [Clostridium saccharoperbutylacetonicum]